MLKPATLLTLSLLVSCLSFEQISNFRAYQQDINEAELNLINGHKIEALNIYYNTLTKSDGNFAKDIYNSLILSMELNRVDTFFVLLNLAKSKNFSNEYLDTLTEFKTFHNNKKWKDFLYQNQQKIYIDTTQKKIMDSLHIADQQFRIKDGSYQVYGDTIKRIDSSNVDYLMRLIYKKGLPGEKQIGAKNFKGDEGYDIVLHHWSQNRSQDKKIISLTPFLANEVRQGRIEPNKCANYLEMQNDEIKTGGFSVTRVVYQDSITSYYAPKYSELQKMLINLYRKWMFLELLDDYYEKVKYQATHPESKYKFDIVLNTFHLSTKQDYDMYLKYEAGVELK